jgi:hypothetical protein
MVHLHLASYHRLNEGIKLMQVRRWTSWSPLSHKPNDKGIISSSNIIECQVFCFYSVQSILTSSEFSFLSKRREQTDISTVSYVHISACLHFTLSQQIRKVYLLFTYLWSYIPSISLIHSTKGFLACIIFVAIKAINK